MKSIGALFSNGFTALLGNWQKIAVVLAIVWVVHALVDTGKEIGKLSEITEKNGEELTAIRGQLSNLQEVSNQMLDITKQQMALTQKLDADYEQRKKANEQTADANVSAVTNGTLRLSIRKPVTPATHPIPYPATAGQ